MDKRRVRHPARRPGTWARSAAGALVALALGLVAGGCASTDANIPPGTIRVATTTNIIGDLATVIGGDRVHVTELMGPGVDPHLYKASAGDIDTLADADVIFYGGLELEGRMADLFEEISADRRTVAVSRDMPTDRLISLASGHAHDPHVWFDVDLWKDATQTVTDTYVEMDPEHADEYRARATAYRAKLDALTTEIERAVATIPPRSRVLVTSHDAFAYFGRRYGLDVEAIQGVSTASEATTGDIRRVAQVIADRHVKTVFIESSVPRQTIEAVIAEAAHRGQTTTVGGELFTDSAGSAGTPEASYIGMVRYNVTLITRGLR